MNGDIISTSGRGSVHNDRYENKSAHICHTLHTVYTRCTQSVLNVFTNEDVLQDATIVDKLHVRGFGDQNCQPFM